MQRTAAKIAAKLEIMEPCCSVKVRAGGHVTCKSQRLDLSGMRVPALTC